MNTLRNAVIVTVLIVAYLLLFYSPLRLFIIPVVYLTTFLHEFGHAATALITGGHVYSIHIGADGSGLTTTSGGSNALTLMGGYIGSAIFGNVLLRLSFTRAAKMTIAVLACAMVFSSLIWFSDLFTTGLLIGFSIGLYVLSRTPVAPVVLQFLGAASIIYIIQDYNVGPTGDLAIWQQTVSALPPPFVNMFIWLGLALVITYLNVKSMLTDYKYST